MFVAVEDLAAERHDTRLRAPAAPVALAGMIGVLVDRLYVLPVVVGWSLLLACVLVVFVAPRRRSLVATTLLVGSGIGFALWHHAWNADPPAGHVFHHATEAGRLVELEARLAETSWSRPQRSGEPVTILIVEVEALVESTASRSSPLVPCTGRVRVMVPDVALDLNSGTRIRLVGRLFRPLPALNPGGFSSRDWLRSQGIEALLRTKNGAGLTILTESPNWSDQLANWRHRIRETAAHSLRDGTSPEVAVVGEALLLGTRTALPDELREAFANSGLLHVLAISGVNVGLIWIGLVRCFRLLGGSLRSSTWAVIGGLLAYAWLTDVNPPIVRAVTVAIVIQLAEVSRRRVSGLQVLSLAVLAVLLRNPTDLLNIGAQLSFLSVAVLHTTSGFHRQMFEATSEDREPSNWLNGLTTPWIQGSLVTSSIWLATAPLIAWRFHVVSWAGLLLNLVLGPILCVLLWAGYCWLVCLAVVPALATIPRAVFATLLSGLIEIARLAGGTSFGHWNVAGPPGWWVLAFYLVLGVWVSRPDRTRWCVRAGVVLVNAGLFWMLIPPAGDGLICDVTAVGHGLGVVLHCPNGRTLVYDAGSLAGPESAALPVCESLWNRHTRRVDALVLSHADADHCNGVVELLDRLDVRALFAHPSFLESEQVTVQAVKARWNDTVGDIPGIAQGAVLQLDPAVKIEVIHPEFEARYSRDNANSLVLLIEYAGRRVLLTGDLERDGLEALLRRPRTPVDVLIAPHHGSPAANPSELAAWANPEWVILSAADLRAVSRLDGRYPPPTQVLHTQRDGRIRCEIGRDGDLTVTRFRVD